MKNYLCYDEGAIKNAADIINEYLVNIETGLQTGSLNDAKIKVLEQIKSATRIICESEVNNHLLQEHETLKKENSFFTEKIAELEKVEVSATERIFSFGVLEGIKKFLSELKREVKQNNICGALPTNRLDCVLDVLENELNSVSSPKEPNITNLYIIGNGFDLKHNLPTHYSDFAVFCRKKAPELFEKMNELYPRLSINGLWSDFENALEFPDIKKLKQRQKNKEEIEKQNGQKDYSIGVEPEDLKGIFNDWVRTLNDLIQRLTIEKRYDLNPEDYFITFNYTNVLEYIYGIDDFKVLHIHEKSETDDNGCIYGHGGLFDTVGAEQQEIKSYIDDYKKGIQNDKLKDWLQEHDICPKRIIVLGHSMASVDGLYFKYLVAKFPNAEWSIHYFGDSDLISKFRTMSNLKIRPSFVCDN